MDDREQRGMSFSFGIWSLQWSSDGREVIAGTGDQCLCVFDVERMRVRTMRFGSTAKVLLKCKLKYYRISECNAEMAVHGPTSPEHSLCATWKLTCRCPGACMHTSFIKQKLMRSCSFTAHDGGHQQELLYYYNYIVLYYIVLLLLFLRLKAYWSSPQSLQRKTRLGLFSVIGCASRSHEVLDGSCSLRQRTMTWPRRERVHFRMRKSQESMGTVRGDRSIMSTEKSIHMSRRDILQTP